MAAASVAAVSQYAFVGSYNQNQDQFSPERASNTIIFVVEMPQAITSGTFCLQFNLALAGINSDTDAKNNVTWDPVLGAHGLIQNILTANALKGQTVELVPEYGNNIKLRMQAMNNHASVSNSPTTLSYSSWSETTANDFLKGAVVSDAQLTDGTGGLDMCMPFLTGFWQSGMNTPCDTMTGIGGIRLQIQLAPTYQVFYSRNYGTDAGQSTLSTLRYVIRSPQLFFMKSTPDPTMGLQIFNGTQFWQNSFNSIQMRFSQPLTVQAGLNCTITSIPTRNLNSLAWNHYALCYPGFFDPVKVGKGPVSEVFPTNPEYVNYLKGSNAYPIELEQFSPITQLRNTLDALTGSIYIVDECPLVRVWKQLQPVRNQTLYAASCRYSVGGGVSFLDDMIGFILQLYAGQGPLSSTVSSSSYLRSMMDRREAVQFPAAIFAVAR